MGPVDTMSVGTCHICGRISTVFITRPDGSLEEYCAICIDGEDPIDDDDEAEEGWT